MTIGTNPPRYARKIYADAATHHFEIGQAVRLKPSFGQPQPVEIYHITAMLPAIGEFPQYRIRADGENHDRMTTQDKLEPANSSSTGEGGSLVERTFHRG